MAVRGVVRTVDAEAIALTGLHARQIAVPDEAVDLGQVDPRLVHVTEQAQLHASAPRRSAKLTPVPSYVAPSG